jgi:hypothetical protein
VRDLVAARGGLLTISDDLICVTVDVEWAHDEVLADLVRLLDEHAVRATFFCTHPGIQVLGHERALHPNFRRTGDALRTLYRKAGSGLAALTDLDVYRDVVQATKAFCPEATGVRAHSLHYDTQLVAIYESEGIEYDSSYCMPLVDNIRPFWKERGVLEIPIYYMDHVDLMERGSEFDVSRLCLNRPGLKVLDFHPNMVYTNAPTCDFYEDTKTFYGQPERLRAVRHTGRGVRSLFVDLLDCIARRRMAAATLGEVNRLWRQRR